MIGQPYQSLTIDQLALLGSNDDWQSPQSEGIGVSRRNYMIDQNDLVQVIDRIS
jgi:hypothetical protein